MPNDKVSSKSKIFFAIMIFLHHFPYNGGQLFLAGGSLGVSFFIMLSGFVMSAGYGEKVLSENFDFKSYYLKRIIRLWPLHLLCLLGYVILNAPGSVSSFKQIGLLGVNALILQSWIPMDGVYFSGNAVSWCLCDLMFCYLMYPLLYRIINKITTRVLSIALLVIFALYFAALQVIPNEKIHALVYISPIFRLMDFSIGIFAYQIFKYLVDHRIGTFVQNWPKLVLTCFEIIPIVLLTFCILLYPNVAQKYRLTSMWWPICFVVVVTYSLLSIYGGGIVGCSSKQNLVKSLRI